MRRLSFYSVYFEIVIIITVFIAILSFLFQLMLIGLKLGLEYSIMRCFHEGFNFI